MNRSGVVRFARIAACLLVIALSSGALARPAHADVSFSFFYSNLGQHGAWQVSSEYGQVWQPSVYSPGWHPYYDGHWVYSDVGWVWVSDYAWGAIPYHYGTWVADPYLGWVWVPGYVWAPSWVVFRTGPDYIGWCPVPAGYSVGASFAFARVGAGPFVFVRAQDFLAPRIRVHAVPRSRTNVVFARTKIVNNITVRNNVVVNPGPDVRVVEKARGRRIDAVPIERVERVVPGERFSRERLRVDPKEHRRGVRAAEPRAANATVATARRGRIEPEQRRERLDPKERHLPPRPEARPSRAEPERSSRVSREPTVRRDRGTREPSDRRQVSPKGKSESQPGARTEGKAKRSAEKKPPKRPPRDSGPSHDKDRPGSR